MNRILQNCHELYAHDGYDFDMNIVVNPITNRVIDILHGLANEVFN